jgi:hypothetical protein
MLLPQKHCNFVSIYFYIFCFLKEIIMNLLNEYIWGLGIGDWGLGIGDWGFGPIRNPHKQ